MKKQFFIFLLSIPCIFLSSCFELIEDLKINADGSGRLKTVLNLSKSKDQILTIWEKDSIMGRPVVHKEQIEQELTKIKKSLSLVEGITSSEFECDWERMTIRYSIDFSSLQGLNAAVDTIANHYTPQGLNRQYSVKFKLEGDQLSRKIHPEIISKAKKETTKLGMGIASLSYIATIYRSELEILKSNRSSATISKSKTSIFARSTLSEFMEDPNASSFEITLHESK